MKLSEYVDQQLLKFYTNLKQSIDDQGQDTVHDFRVALKKIFALQRLLNQVDEGGWNNNYAFFAPIKTLFKCAGDIRDYQVMQSGLEEWLTSTQIHRFNHYLNENITQKFTDLENIDKDLLLDELINQVKIAFQKLYNLPETIVMNYITHQVSIYEKWIEDELQSELCNYHKIRRYVKNQYYYLSILEEVLNDNSFAELTRQKDQLGKKLGLWHDYKVLSKHIGSLALENHTEVVSRIEAKANELIEEIF